MTERAALARQAALRVLQASPALLQAAALLAATVVSPHAAVSAWEVAASSPAATPTHPLPRSPRSPRSILSSPATPKPATLPIATPPNRAPAPPATSSPTPRLPGNILYFIPPGRLTNLLLLLVSPRFDLDPPPVNQPPATASTPLLAPPPLPSLAGDPLELPSSNPAVVAVADPQPHPHRRPSPPTPSPPAAFLPPQMDGWMDGDDGSGAGSASTISRWGPESPDAVALSPTKAGSSSTFHDMHLLSGHGGWNQKKQSPLTDVAAAHLKW
ncbi:vegetative cell wall protein gp1-like [Triticum aestivum]|uniref:vegetative cell wall protein gp1-like n=1 Tax=Triticum aestivum TaxID=4565 RepID=UPI001D00B152|nr:vegetative cell wall protein gp1-like [Triticum aestivum]